MAARSKQLIALERDGWTALATGDDAARGFYDAVLNGELLMLLPGGLVIDDRQQALDAMSGAPWDDFELLDERVLELDERAAVVAYRVSAHRAGRAYEALCNSTYVTEDGAWRLVLHQQTPLA